VGITELYSAKRDVNRRPV